jgi:CBS domain containing-hemolysin-like protein
MLRRRRAAAVAPRVGGVGGFSGVGGSHHQEILAALARLEDATVREVMTPRVDVVALREPVSPEDVALAVKESGHSRFPVYAGSGDLDDLVGVLFVKDLFRSGGAVRFRKPWVVPETARVLGVLQQMRARRNAFAVVVDEHGGVEGVLTVKDLVSELVGDLPDEFDRADAVDVLRVDASRWLVDGACAVDRLCEELGPHGLAVPEGEYVTVGGFLFSLFGRIPAEGDAVIHDGWEFRVSEMDRRRIAKVVVRAPLGAGGGASAGAGGGGSGSMISGLDGGMPPKAIG